MHNDYKLSLFIKRLVSIFNSSGKKNCFFKKQFFLEIYQLFGKFQFCSSKPFILEIMIYFLVLLEIILF